jgi:hypothetical protein
MNCDNRKEKRAGQPRLIRATSEQWDYLRSEKFFWRSKIENERSKRWRTSLAGWPDSANFRVLGEFSPLGRIFTLWFNVIRKLQKKTNFWATFVTD